MKLEQKQGLRRRTFEVVGDQIKLMYKTSSETKEWTVNLDSIGNKILIEKKSRKGGILLGGFFLAFGIFFIAVNLADKENTLALWAWIAIGAFYLFLSILIFAVPLKNELHITGGYSQLTFFLESPSREEVDRFVEKLMLKSKKLILERYSKIDPDIPEETMMNQLIWLRNNGMLSEIEFEEKKNEYKTSKIIK